MFSCRVGNSGSKESEKVKIKTVLNALRRIGFNLEFDGKEISELVELERNLESAVPDRLEDAIAEVDDMDFIAKQTVEKYAERLSCLMRSSLSSRN